MRLFTLAAWAVLLLPMLAIEAGCLGLLWKMRPKRLALRSPKGEGGRIG